MSAPGVIPSCPDDTRSRRRDARAQSDPSLGQPAPGASSSFQATNPAARKYAASCSITPAISSGSVCGSSDTAPR